MEHDRDRQGRDKSPVEDLDEEGVRGEGNGEKRGSAALKRGEQGEESRAGGGLGTWKRGR